MKSSVSYNREAYEICLRKYRMMKEKEQEQNQEQEKKEEENKTDENLVYKTFNIKKTKNKNKKPIDASLTNTQMITSAGKFIFDVTNELVNTYKFEPKTAVEIVKRSRLYTAIETRPKAVMSRKAADVANSIFSDWILSHS